MNGMEFAKYVRSNEKLSKIPLIALSSLSDEHSQSILDSGFDERLYKFDKDEFMQVVSKYTTVKMEKKVANE